MVSSSHISSRVMDILYGLRACSAASSLSRLRRRSSIDDDNDDESVVAPRLTSACNDDS